MDRERFESRLDTVIAAHGRKVRSGIDAAACGTRSDWLELHKAEDAFLEARDAFLAEVFAPPPATSPSPVVVGWEERDQGRTRGRPVVWRRGVEIRMVFRGVVYSFTADADSLTLAAGAVASADDAELRSPDFNPLRGGHSVRLRGIDYRTADRGPEELERIAVDACRAVASRLLAYGIDSSTVTRAWPEGVPGFADMVKLETSKVLDQPSA